MKRKLVFKKLQKPNLSTKLMWAFSQRLPDILMRLSVAKLLLKRLVKNCVQRAGLGVCGGLRVPSASNCCTANVQMLIENCVAKFIMSSPSKSTLANQCWGLIRHAAITPNLMLVAVFLRFSLLSALNLSGRFLCQSQSFFGWSSRFLCQTQSFFSWSARFLCQSHRFFS